MNILLYLYKSLSDSTIYLKLPIYNTFTTHRTYFSYQSTQNWHRSNKETLFKDIYILLQHFVKREFLRCIFSLYFLHIYPHLINEDMKKYLKIEHYLSI